MSTDGTAIDFGSKALLGLALTDNSLRTGNYAEIHVSPTSFEGKLLNGLPVSIGMNEINHAELKVLDAGKTQTAWIVVGTVLLTGALVGLAAARASTPCYYCY